MKIKKLNKKAAAYKMLNYTFLRMVFVILFFFTIYMFASYGTKANFNIQKTKDLVFIHRAINSPHSFIYTNPITKRSYPGIIDLTRFDSEIIEKAMNYSENKVAAKFELTNLENEEKSEIYLNKKWYDRWQPLTKFEQYGKGMKQQYVLIKEENEIKKGLLRTEVVIHIE